MTGVQTCALPIYTECLVHGDCTKELQKLKSGSVDLVLTDPPYGKDLKMRNDTGWDGKTYDDEFQHVMNVIDLAIKEYYRILKDNTHMYIFFGTEHMQTVRDMVRKHGFYCPNVPCIWHKTGGGGPKGSPQSYAINYESFFLCSKGSRNLNKEGVSNVLVYPRIAPQRKIHPTEKPTALLRELIEQSSLPGDLVVDGFAGGNTTMMAAWECKREAWACEMDKEYYQQGVLKIEGFVSGSEKE